MSIFDDLDDLSGDIFQWGEEAEPEQKRKISDEARSRALDRRTANYKTFRALSDTALDEILAYQWQKGHTYHIISGGNVDALAFLKSIVKQQHVYYCLISTWTIAEQGLKELESWTTRGFIDRLDLYPGDIVARKYTDALEHMKAICTQSGGRACPLQTHAKVIVAYGSRFNAVVECSANINTNVRIEQFTVTVNDRVADFYKEFFDEQGQGNAKREGWTPWRKN